MFPDTFQSKFKFPDTSQSKLTFLVLFIRFRLLFCSVSLFRLLVCSFSLFRLLVCSFSLFRLLVCSFSLFRLLVCSFSLFRLLVCFFSLFRLLVCSCFLRFLFYSLSFCPDFCSDLSIYLFLCLIQGLPAKFRKRVSIIKLYCFAKFFTLLRVEKNSHFAKLHVWRIAKDFFDDQNLNFFDN